jgi:hypothetical protein
MGLTKVPYVEHVPPDVTACIFWLKNRDPEHWRDTRQHEHVLGKYIISDQPMTEESAGKAKSLAGRTYRGAGGRLGAYKHNESKTKSPSALGGASGSYSPDPC